jgi:hypothetical protein
MAAIISLIRDPDMGIDAFAVSPARSEKSLSIIFWKISSIASNSSRFYLRMQFSVATPAPVSLAVVYVPQSDWNKLQSKTVLL